MICTAIFAMLSFFVPPAITTIYYHNNVAFTDPEWTMNYLPSSQIINLINEMKTLKIKYQMIDLGFFDKFFDSGHWHPVIDGSMDAIHAALLPKWLAFSRIYAPEMKLLGVVNGNTYLHVLGTEYGDVTPAIPQTQMHENIAAHCQYLINVFRLDGIVLDFEPLTNASTADYIKLIETIRNKIDADKLIVVCGSIDLTVLNSAYISAYKDKVDIFLSMNYDTGLITDTTYKSYVSYSVKLISDVFKNSSTRYVPLGPGKYPEKPMHNMVENSHNHSLAVVDAIARGAVIYGSGVWWFPGIVESATDKADFLQYWVNQYTPQSD